MTDDELRAIERDFDADWSPAASAERERHGRALLAEVRRLTTELAMAQASDERQELRADNARLRGLVKDAEVAAGESCGECPWCGAGPSTQHAPECPAFTESGDVR